MACNKDTDQPAHSDQSFHKSHDVIKDLKLSIELKLNAYVGFFKTSLKEKGSHAREATVSKMFFVLIRSGLLQKGRMSFSGANTFLLGLTNFQRD